MRADGRSASDAKLDGDKSPAAGGDTATACVPESQGEFCVRLSGCRAFQAADNCNVSRSVDCGECTLPDVCGGATVPNRCAVNPWFDLDASSFAPRTTRVRWHSGGGDGLGPAGVSSPPALAYDASGRLIAVWETGSIFVPSGRNVQGALFSNGSWMPFVEGALVSGGISQSTRGASLPVLERGPTGEVFLAYGDVDVVAVNRIWVKQLVGDHWEVRGGNAVNTASSASAKESRLAIDALGRPVVAWRTPTGTAVARLVGGVWTEVGMGSMADAGVTEPSGAWDMSVDGTGEPAIAWWNGGVGLHLLRYDGSGWTSVGGSTSGSGIAPNASDLDSVSLLADAGGRLTAFWVGGDDIRASVFDGGNWVDVSPGSRTPGIFLAGDINNRLTTLIDSANRLTMMWAFMERDLSPRFRAYAQRLEAGTWSEMLGSSTWPGLADQKAVTGVAMAVDPAGPLAAGWIGDSRFYVAEHTADAWMGLGSDTIAGRGIELSAGSPIQSDLALTANGRPTVAWRDAESRGVLLVEFDGTIWQQLAGSGSGPSIFGVFSYGPSILIQPNGYPAVASANAGGVHYHAWDGAQWTGLANSDTVSPIAGSTGPLEVCLQAAGKPMLVTSSDAGLQGAYWDGGAWQPAGVDGMPTGVIDADSGQFSLAQDPSGDPWLAYMADVSGGHRVYVRHWDGTAWQDPTSGSASGTGTATSTSNSASPHVVVDSRGRPVVGFGTGLDGQRRFDVVRLESGAWQSLGSALLEANGDAGDGSSVTVTLSPGGQPAVLWSAPGADGEEVFGRAYDGSVWTPISPGGDFAGGISNSVAASLGVVGAAIPGRLCAVWEEQGADGLVLVLRCAE